MNIFKSGTLTWWQAGIFKISVFSLGLIVGSHFSEIFINYTILLFTIAIIAGFYIAYVWFR